MSFIIIKDSREQKGLDFPGYTVEVAKLPTGDYTIKGLEDTLFIERKYKISEFYANCTQDRFWKEMERAKPFTHKFLVLEFTYDDVLAIPYSLNLPKTQWAQLKLKPQYIVKCIGDIQVKYGVHVVFAGNRETAAEMIINIMKRVDENRP